MVADVEVLVVDPDRVGEMPGDGLHALAVARHERDPVEDQRHEPVVVEAPESPGSKISTVALCAAWSASRARGTRGRAARSRSLIAPDPHPSRLVPVVGFLQRSQDARCVPSVTIVKATTRAPSQSGGRLDAARARCPHPRRLHRRPAGCGDDDSSGSGDGNGPRHQDHRHHHLRRHVTPNGDRVAVQVGPAASSWSSRPTQEGEIHVHSAPEQELEYGAGTTTLPTFNRSTSRASSTVESHTLEKTIVQLEVKCPVRPDLRSGAARAHGIGGSKDLPIPLELTIAGAVAALDGLASPCWRSRGATPRYDAATGPAGRRPAWLARDRRLAAPWFLRRGCSGCSAFALHGAGRGRAARTCLINPFFGIFYVLLWVGFVPASLLFGPACKAISPVRTINAGVRQAHRRRPRRGRVHLPRAARLLAGGARPVRVRLDGAGLPVRHRARPGAAVVRGVRRRDAASAARCSATRSTSAPTRSRSTRPGRADVGLGPP